MMKISFKITSILIAMLVLFTSCASGQVEDETSEPSETVETTEVIEYNTEQFYNPI